MKILVKWALPKLTEPILKAFALQSSSQKIKKQSLELRENFNKIQLKRACTENK